MQPLILLSLFLASADTVKPPTLPEPPRMTVSGPKAGDKLPGVLPLDANTFRFVSFPNYDGPITFDITGDATAVTIFTVKSGDKKTGKHYGEQRWAEHPVPESKSETSMVVGETVGTVTLAAWGIIDSKPAKLGVLTLNVGGAPPVPPDPKPSPKPEPTGEGAWVEIIEETAARSVDTIRIVKDSKFWDSLEAKGHATRFYDKDSKDVPAGHYKGDTLPVLLIVSKAGVVIHRGPLPNTTAKIADVVTLATGVK